MVIREAGTTGGRLVIAAMGRVLAALMHVLPDDVAVDLIETRRVLAYLEGRGPRRIYYGEQFHDVVEVVDERGRSTQAAEDGGAN
jgi:hypothetical protein